MCLCFVLFDYSCKCEFLFDTYNATNFLDAHVLANQSFPTNIYSLATVNNVVLGDDKHCINGLIYGLWASLPMVESQ